MKLSAIKKFLHAHAIVQETENSVLILRRGHPAASEFPAVDAPEFYALIALTPAEFEQGQGCFKAIVPAKWGNYTVQTRIDAMPEAVFRIVQL